MLLGVVISFLEVRGIFSSNLHNQLSKTNPTSWYSHKQRLRSREDGMTAFIVTHFHLLDTELVA